MNNLFQPYISYRFLTIPIRNDLKYTDEYIKYNDVEDVLYDYVNVIVLDDKSYDDYKNSIGLKEDKIIHFNSINKLLCHKTIIYNSKKPRLKII